MVGLELTDIQLPQALKDRTKNDVTPQLADEQTLRDHTCPHHFTLSSWKIFPGPVILSSDSGRLMKGDMSWS